MWASADDLLLPDFLARNHACMDEFPQARLAFSRISPSPGDDAAAASYSVCMRELLMVETERAAYAATDMDPILFAYFRNTGERFEYPTDGHWNALAYGLAA